MEQTSEGMGDTLQRIKHLSRRSRPVSGRASTPSSPSPQTPTDKNLFWNLLNNSMVSDHTGRTYAMYDISPELAVHKIQTLIEQKKYQECTVFIDKLNDDTLKETIPNMPTQAIISAIPDTLPIIDSLYIFGKKHGSVLLDHMCADETVKQIVKWFVKCDTFTHTRHASNTSTSSNSSLQQELSLGHCSSILNIISSFDVHLYERLDKRCRSLDCVLGNLAKHGLVTASNQQIMNLHDALKIEFTKTMVQYRSAVQKLEELSLTQRSMRPTSVSEVPAPIGSGHQRLMNIYHSEVETRLIKNKSLFNVVEPALSNLYLSDLLSTLESRIEYDKETLFYYCELRKEMKDIPGDAIVNEIFQKYSNAYCKVLDIIRESSRENVDGPNDVFDGDERLKDLQVTTLGDSGRTNKKTTQRGDARLLPDASDDSINTPTLNNSVADIPSFNGSAAYPVPPNMTSNPTCSTSSSGVSHKEVQTLRNEVKKMKKELSNAREMIVRYEEREHALKDRLSEQARRQIDKSGKFEDLSLGVNRPTQLIQRYGYLYAQTRVDALDALDSLQELADVDSLKGKLLFSVVILSFRCAQSHFQTLRSQVCKLLYLPTHNLMSHDPVAKEMNDTIATYLRKTVDRFDTQPLIEEVSSQIFTTLFDYPSLKTCSGLKQYVDECVNLAWRFTAQNPPITIEFDCADFEASKHTRFHSSNPQSNDLQTYIWPSLVEVGTGVCLHKGVVVT